MANVNKHRRGMSGLHVEEVEKWGRDAARQRYGQPQHEDGAPPPSDRHAAQDAGNRGEWRVDSQAPTAHDTAGWVRGSASGTPKMGGETGETMPNFDRRGPDGLPKKW